MLDKIVSEKILNLLDLIRFDKPIGFMLLVWPCWFGLAYTNKSINELFFWYIYFFIGAFLMRSAGCIINDLIDINIDKKVKRTSTRPLVSKKITILEAILFLSLHILLSLTILIQFNYNAILKGISSIPLIVFSALLFLWKFSSLDSLYGAPDQSFCICPI